MESVLIKPINICKSSLPLLTLLLADTGIPRVMPLTRHRKPDPRADTLRFKWLTLQRITFRGGEHFLDGMGEGDIVVDSKELVRDLCIW